MPIYEIICKSCRYQGEVLELSSATMPACPACGSPQTEKLMSATSSLTGREGQAMPGPADTTCCGHGPGVAGCSGPGSCCGKNI
jgi:putative FmdB family regulatory protein